MLATPAANTAAATPVVKSLRALIIIGPFGFPSTLRAPAMSRNTR